MSCLSWNPPADERRCNNDFFFSLLIGPCQRGVLSWRGKWHRYYRRAQSPSLCRSPPITPDPASPYLAPPQTASAAFFIWTSKTVPVIKIAPAFGCRDQPLRSENGMWERRLAKCANSVLTCLRLNFNRFERGRRMGGAEKKPHIAINRHYLWHRRTQLFQGFWGLWATVLYGDTQKCLRLNCGGRGGLTDFSASRQRAKLSQWRSPQTGS